MFEELSVVAPALAIGCSITGVAFLFGRSLFTRRLGTDPEAIAAGSDEALLGVVSNRRATPRRAGNIVEVALWDGSDTPQLRATVADRSQGGVRLIVDRQIAEGTSWKVRPRFVPVTTPWTTIIVRTSRLVDGRWEIGCQFEQTPNYNVLLMFG